MAENTTAGQRKGALDPSPVVKHEQTLEIEQVHEDAYVTGFKLVLVVASLAMACFLVLMDTMVISTVRC